MLVVKLPVLVVAELDTLNPEVVEPVADQVPVQPAPLIDVPVIDGAILLVTLNVIPDLGENPAVGFAAVDVFMCGDCNPRDTLKKIVDTFSPIVYTINVLDRGPTYR